MDNALCYLGGPCAQRLVSPGGALRTTPCVIGGVCATPCVAQRLVTDGGPVHNALCPRVPVHNAFTGGGLCTTPCVGACAQRLVLMGGACAQRLASPDRGPVRNALCH